MNKLSTLLCLTLLLITAPAVMAGDMSSSVMVWNSVHQFSDHGDFIIYNNTAYGISMESNGWSHSGILDGGSMKRNSVRVDPNLSLKTGDNSGTLVLSVAKPGAGWSADDSQTRIKGRFSVLHLFFAAFPESGSGISGRRNDFSCPGDV